LSAAWLAPVNVRVIANAPRPILDRNVPEPLGSDPLCEIEARHVPNTLELNEVVGAIILDWGAQVYNNLIFT